MASISFRGKNKGLQIGDNNDSVLHWPLGKSGERDKLATVTNRCIQSRATGNSTQPSINYPFPSRSEFCQSRHPTSSHPREKLVARVENRAGWPWRCRVSGKRLVCDLLLIAYNDKEIATCHRIRLPGSVRVASNMGLLGSCEQRSPLRARFQGYRKPGQSSRLSRS